MYLQVWSMNFGWAWSWCFCISGMCFWFSIWWAGCVIGRRLYLGIGGIVVFCGGSDWCRIGEQEVRWMWCLGSVMWLG